MCVKWSLFTSPHSAGALSRGWICAWMFLDCNGINSEDAECSKCCCICRWRSSDLSRIKSGMVIAWSLARMRSFANIMMDICVPADIARERSLYVWDLCTSRGEPILLLERISLSCCEDCERCLGIYPEWDSSPWEDDCGWERVFFPRMISVLAMAEPSFRSLVLAFCRPGLPDDCTIRAMSSASLRVGYLGLGSSLCWSYALPSLRVDTLDLGSSFCKQCLVFHMFLRESLFWRLSKC